MKKPYELLIDFCKAEVVKPTKDWVSVELRGDHYNVVFLPLSHSVQILRREFLDMRNARDARLFGDQYVPYEDDPKFLGIAHMLGLISPWIPCSERLPEIEIDFLVCTDAGYQDVAKIHFLDADGKPWWFNGDIYLTVTHWQPLPTDPLDRS